MNCSPSGSSVHEIFQARIPGWVAISISNKEVWAPKNWFFQTVVLEKTLESLLDSKKINQPWISQSKEINPEFSYYFDSEINLLSSNSECSSRWVVYEVYVVKCLEMFRNMGLELRREESYKDQSSCTEAKCTCLERRKWEEKRGQDRTRGKANTENVQGWSESWEENQRAALQSHWWREFQEG